MDNLFKKFLSYFYGSGVGLIIGLITTIISTRLLSPEDFGKASMFTLALNILMILIVFGTDQAFVRFFYEEVSEMRGKLLFNSLKLPLILLGAIVTILYFSREILMRFLFNEVNYQIFWVLIVCLVFQVVYRFSLLIIRMQQKGHLYSLMEIMNKSFNLSSIILLFYIMGPNYKILIFSSAITLISLTIVSIFLERKFWNSLFTKHTETKHSQLDIIKFSYPLVLTTAIIWLFQSLDKIAIRQWSNFEELGLYTAAFKIVALLTVVQTVFSTFWAPVCYEHFQKYPDDKDFFSKTSKIISLVMFQIAIVTIVFKDIIVMLLGPEYIKAAVIMPFLIFMPMMYTMSETTVVGINFFKKTKWHIFIALTACAANAIGNFLLVPSYGAAGAAISTGLAYILFYLLRTYISLKYFKVDYDLKRVCFLLGCISLYALQNTIFSLGYINYLVGIILIFIVTIFYKNELKNLFLLFINKRNGVKV